VITLFLFAEIWNVVGGIVFGTKGSFINELLFKATLCSENNSSDYIPYFSKKEKRDHANQPWIESNAIE
jgi:hypothetical protein